MNLIICAGLWNLIPCEWFDIKLYLWNVSDFEDKFEVELKRVMSKIPKWRVPTDMIAQILAVVIVW